MKNHIIRVLFLLTRSRLNKESKSVIKCRITYNQKRKEFSTGQFVSPKNWNSKQQLVKPPEPDCDYTNNQLSLIKTKINRAFLMLQVKEETFTVVDVFKCFRGEKTAKEYNTIEYFERYLKRLKKLINIDIKHATWKKFEYVKKHVQSFIKWQYKSNDYPLKKLKLQFLNDLEYYLKTEKKLGQATINKIIQRFKKPVNIAVAEGYLDRDPFMHHKSKSVRTEIVFLSPEELQLFEKYKFTQPRLRLVQDLFVFCCYTGLPYRELMDLEQKHIVKGFDDNLWIKMKREKTSKEFSIPLLAKAEAIMNKYNGKLLVFPRLSNQRYNSYLKEIAAIVGIEKRLTTHMARRTFASTVLLYNDVPMEIVSKLLGHSSMKTTQDSYGKIVEKKISLEMEKLKGSG
jgi:integrase